ncbi:GPP34 family phosphoprotein [Streptomyces sp. NPDC090303]|uniref:GOLPH3/VPS74 family protein n=1 Tax=Streptomyces sp. NPDC090303 TaxID=3365960 RepID=UPI0037F18EF1
MSTARDLFVIAMDSGREPPVGQGDLSLALAGAELIDLLGHGHVTVDGDRVVPGVGSVLRDRLLGEASDGIVRTTPYEETEQWLWRRGEGLSATYQSTLEAEGELARKRGGRLTLGARRLEPVDTAARRDAVDRWQRRDPVLVALASAVGIGRGDDSNGNGDGDPGTDRDGDGSAVVEPGLDDEATTAVVAAVHDAIMELEAVRQRRTIENAAFANLWRGP